MSGTGGNEYSTEQQVMGVLDVNVNESKDNNQATPEQARTINDAESFKNAIKDKETTADELNKQMDNGFLEELKKSLTPDDAKDLKDTIEKIEGYDKPNTPLNDVYKYVVNVFIYNSFNTEGSQEHNNISEEMRFDVNKYLHPNIKIGINRFVGMLKEKNQIVKDDKIADLIIATESILNGNDISGKSLLKIADYLGISLKDDEKYDKQGRLNRLGKEIFGIDSHSLLKKLEEEVVNTEARYKERFIPATFNDDILLENQFLQYSPAMSGDASGEIEFRERTNIIKNPTKENEERMELGIFDSDGNLLEGTRKEPNQIKSGIFENGNLKEGYIINESNNVLIGAFNYDKKQNELTEKMVDGQPTGEYEINPDRYDNPDVLIRGQGITYIPNEQYINYIDNSGKEYNFKNYTYNSANNTITLGIENSLVIIDKNGENWEKLVFDYLVQYDPMNCIDDSITIQPANSSTTIFQQFCENNGINYVNTKNDIQNGIESINNENLNILSNIDIVNLLSITKGEAGTFNCNGTYKISDNNIQECYEIGGEQKWNNCDNNPLISGLTGKWANFSTLDTEELGKLSEENKKLGNLKFENRAALEKFIIENDLTQIYINKIKEFLGASTSESPNQDNPSNDIENQNNDTENPIDISQIHLSENNIKKIFIDKNGELTKDKITEFFNKAKDKENLTDDQKKLLQLAYEGLTQERKGESSSAYKNVVELQEKLLFTNGDVDGKFGINTFNKLKDAFQEEQPIVKEEIVEEKEEKEEEKIIVNDPANTPTPQDKKKENVNKGEEIQARSWNDVINTLEKGLNGNSLSIDGKYIFKYNRCEHGDETFTKKTNTTTTDILEYESSSGNKIIIDSENNSVNFIDSNNEGKGYRTNGDVFEGTFNQYFHPQSGTIKHKNNEIPNPNPMLSNSKSTSFTGSFDGRQEINGIREGLKSFYLVNRTTYTSRIEYNGGYSNNFYIYKNNDNKILYTESYYLNSGQSIPQQQNIKKVDMNPLPMTAKKDGDKLVLTPNGNSNLKIEIDSSGNCTKTGTRGNFDKKPNHNWGKLVYNTFFS